jgi:hypothetical protein
LAAIYVLGHGDHPQIEALQRQEAILHLIRHTYVARFGQQLLQGTAAREHLRQCIRLLERVRLCHLRRPACLEALPELAHMVERDLDRLGCEPPASLSPDHRPLPTDWEREPVRQSPTPTPRAGWPVLCQD